MDFDIEVNGRIRITRLLTEDGRPSGIETRKVELPEGMPFKPANIRDLEGTDTLRRGFSAVIMAIGMRSALPREQAPGLFYAGDMAHGPTTVVESVASGKNTALEIDAWLTRRPEPVFEGRIKSHYLLPGSNPVPVSLETDFFGRPIHSPYLLSASPLTDGLEQMNLAYRSGWAGGIMKTAFDNVPIHIPAEYMFTFGPHTYANADNVSGHPLDRVCREVEQLIKQWPDRLTMASTGGPVTGNDENDRLGWQSNTRKLEAAGVMGIEYSLSCPQGGDGTEGDIVSQNAAITAKIIDWIMEVGSPDVPKLFKLTAAVTSIVPDPARHPQGAGQIPAEESRHHAGELLPHTGIPPRAGPPLGGRRRGRHERRRCDPHLQSDPRHGRPPGDRDLRQRRPDELQGCHGLPGAGRQDRPVLHHRHQVRLRHHP